ncbi:MAG: hypothetical protein KGJ30_00820 [Burkholderiales bacterium]|nr:hypothetical protein [Burkholderiales bacterium]MDE1925916.1 hypothetical protein [Burkholderiales bacterium]MDE2157433.1 hypothetical protein [Burkholderiales bacterium]
MTPSKSDREVALIVVEYGSGHVDAELARLLRGPLASPGRRVEHVRTDIAPSRCLATPNEAYEFSGYQEGLMRLLADSKWTEDPLTSRVVIFVNDTIATSHARPLSSFVLDRLSQLDMTRVATPALVGLSTRLSGPVGSATGGMGYASTYAFALIGTVEDLRRVRFYGPDEVAARFAERVLPRLAPDYVETVRTWLEPVHPLMGWHNAVPGRELDPLTRSRKQLAIYLEHTMPRRLREVGFEFSDLGQLLTPPQRLRLAALRHVDRMAINMLKLRTRLPTMLGWDRS